MTLGLYNHEERLLQNNQGIHWTNFYGHPCYYSYSRDLGKSTWYHWGYRSYANVLNYGYHRYP